MRLCKCEAVSKAKYLDLGSPRRVARDAGTDVNTSQYVYKAYGIVVAPWHQNTARSAKFRQCWKTGYSLCIIVVKGSVRKADVETLVTALTHSWVERIICIELTGTITGTAGYIRGAVSRLNLAFNNK
jgi:hypothetical protein